MRRYASDGRGDTARVSDARLAVRVRQGSVEALGELYERHASDLYRAAYRVLGVTTDAEDVVHDVFVGLPGALTKYEERGNFRGWLRTVVLRAALMVRRRRARTVTSDAASLDLMSRQVEEGSGEADATSRIAMERAIEALSEPLRMVFLLREGEGYSHREIGTLLGISSTASAIRLHRAWKELRKRLGIE